MKKYKKIINHLLDRAEKTTSANEACAWTRATINLIDMIPFDDRKEFIESLDEEN